MITLLGPYIDHSECIQVRHVSPNLDLICIVHCMLHLRSSFLIMFSKRSLLLKNVSFFTQRELGFPEKVITHP